MARSWGQLAVFVGEATNFTFSAWGCGCGRALIVLPNPILRVIWSYHRFEMPDIMHDISEVTLDSENGLIFEKNVSIPIKNDDLPIRANVYRPKDDTQRYPVLVTYGPYGKDIWYGE